MMLLNKKGVTMRFSILFLLASIAIGSTSLAQEDSLYRLDLLHTNDLHSHFLPFKTDGSSCTYETCSGGFAKIQTVIQQEKKENPNLILLDAGDRFSGTVFYTLRKGKDIPNLMNEMHYDAMNIGNHDFDDGLDELYKFVQKSNAPVVSANVQFPKNHPLKKEIRPALVIHKNNRQIGIISLLTKDAKTTSAKADEINLLSYEEALTPLVNKLKNQGVDIIILLNHIGIDEDIKLAQNSTDIDIIISAHTHTLLSNNPEEKNAKGGYPLVIKNKNGEKVLIVSAGIGGHHIGKLTAFFDKNGLVHSFSGDTKPIDTSITPDTKMVKMIEDIQSKVNDILTQKIFTTTAPIPLTRNSAFCSESCYVGEILTDALLKAGQKANPNVSLAFLNAGGIRAGFPKGEITFQHMAQTYPFDSKAVIVKIKGADILSYLNHGLKEYILDDRTNAFIQASGLSYLFSAKENRVKNIKINNQPLDMTKEYLVVMPSFLANGGDNFPKLEIIQTLKEKTIREEFISILKEQKLKPFENRIKKMID